LRTANQISEISLPHSITVRENFFPFNHLEHPDDPPAAAGMPSNVHDPLVENLV
jgi:hypothetical protein